jgi:hypothetical protein
MRGQAAGQTAGQAAGLAPALVASLLPELVIAQPQAAALPEPLTVCCLAVCLWVEPGQVGRPLTSFPRLEAAAVAALRAPRTVRLMKMTIATLQTLSEAPLSAVPMRHAAAASRVEEEAAAVVWQLRAVAVGAAGRQPLRCER